MDSRFLVSQQLSENRKRIENKYNAHKFIAYFQNYTNTFLPVPQFRSYMEEAAKAPDIVENCGVHKTGLYLWEIPGASWSVSGAEGISRSQSNLGFRQQIIIRLYP